MRNPQNQSHGGKKENISHLAELKRKASCGGKQGGLSCGSPKPVKEPDTPLAGQRADLQSAWAWVRLGFTGGGELFLGFGSNQSWGGSGSGGSSTGSARQLPALLSLLALLALFAETLQCPDDFEPVSVRIEVVWLKQVIFGQPQLLAGGQKPIEVFPDLERVDLVSHLWELALLELRGVNFPDQL